MVISQALKDVMALEEKVKKGAKSWPIGDSG